MKMHLEVQIILSGIIIVVVNRVTIIAIGHGLLKKFLPTGIGCILRTAGSSLIKSYADPLTFVRTTQLFNLNT